jgi:hypothetical protein
MNTTNTIRPTGPATGLGIQSNPAPPQGPPPTVRIAPDLMIEVQFKGAALSPLREAGLRLALQFQLSQLTGETWSAESTSFAVANGGTATSIGAWLDGAGAGENRAFLLCDLDLIGDAPLDDSTTHLRYFAGRAGLDRMVDLLVRERIEEHGAFYEGSDVRLDAAHRTITTEVRAARIRNSGKHGVVVKLRWEETPRAENVEYSPPQAPRRVKVSTDTRFDGIADLLDLPLPRRGVLGSLVDGGFFPDLIALDAPEDHLSLDVFYDAFSVRETGELVGLIVSAHAQRGDSRPAVGIEGPASITTAGSSVQPDATFTMVPVDMRAPLRRTRWSSPDPEVFFSAPNSLETEVRFALDTNRTTVRTFTLQAEVADADSSTTDPSAGRTAVSTRVVEVKVASAAQPPRPIT